MKLHNHKKKYIHKSPWLSLRIDSFNANNKDRTYEIVERSDSVVIIPLNEQKETLLLKQYRIPTLKYSYEFPMGGIDNGESIEQSAIREFNEETNITITTEQLELLGTFHPIPGLTPQNVTVFVVRVQDDILKKAKKNADEDFEQSLVVPLDDVFEMVHKGEISDGFTLVSLFFLSRYLKLL